MYYAVGQRDIITSFDVKQDTFHRFFGRLSDLDFLTSGTEDPDRYSPTKPRIDQSPPTDDVQFGKESSLVPTPVETVPDAVATVANDASSSRYSSEPESPPLELPRYGFGHNEAINLFRRCVEQLPRGEKVVIITLKRNDYFEAGVYEKK